MVLCCMSKWESSEYVWIRIIAIHQSTKHVERHALSTHLKEAINIPMLLLDPKYTEGLFSVGGVDCPTKYNPGP